MIQKPISEKRQKLIDAKKASELQVGETIWVKYNAGQTFQDKTRESQSNAYLIQAFEGDKIRVIKKDHSVHKSEFLITKIDIIERDLWFLGANPFDESIDDIRPIAFQLSFILYGLNILGEKDGTIDKYKINGVPLQELNWNPFIFNKEGKKEYYQRPFCWSLQDKQLLIESIYQGIDCGKILVREKNWKHLEVLQAKGETDLYFFDIVDGKQRLNAIRGFIMLEYPDMNGNYYSDLSFDSQNRFTSHQLFSYAVMGEKTKDADVLRQFLKLNFCGVIQSKEHIDFVKSLLTKI